MITLKTILVPTDFSDLSQQAMEFAFALAEQFQAKVYLIHVWPIGMSGALFPPELYPAAVLTEEQKAREGHLATVTNDLIRSGFNVEPVFAMGVPYEEIIRAAANLDADLIVMASHGRSGISHLALGSVAEKVLRLAPCPVLTVKARRPVAVQAA